MYYYLILFSPQLHELGGISIPIFTWEKYLGANDDFPGASQWSNQGQVWLSDFSTRSSDSLASQGKKSLWCFHEALESLPGPQSLCTDPPIVGQSHLLVFRVNLSPKCNGWTGNRFVNHKTSLQMLLFISVSYNFCQHHGDRCLASPRLKQVENRGREAGLSWETFHENSQKLNFMVVNPL